MEPESAGSKIEVKIATMPVPSRPTRGLALASALVTLMFSAAIGGVVVRRRLRAAFWLASEVVFYTIMIVAIAAGHPRLMWAGMFAALGWRIAAAVDAYALARKANEIANWRALVCAWLLLTIGAVALAKGVVRPFIVEAFQIPSKAMYPTLFVGDHIFISKLRRTPRRGEVVVFEYPLDRSVDYVKRVVGLPGDVVEIVGGKLTINLAELPLARFQEECPKGKDGYTTFEDAIPCVLSKETLGGRTYHVGTDTVLGSRDMDRKVVPPGTVFVLGDNRDNSSDSRVWGPVPFENIKGIARFIWWSSDPSGVRWDRIDTLVR